MNIKSNPAVMGLRALQAAKSEGGTTEELYAASSQAITELFELSADPQVDKDAMATILRETSAAIAAGAVEAIEQVDAVPEQPEIARLAALVMLGSGLTAGSLDGVLYFALDKAGETAGGLGDNEFFQELEQAIAEDRPAVEAGLLELRAGGTEMVEAMASAETVEDFQLGLSFALGIGYMIAAVDAGLQATA